MSRLRDEDGFTLIELLIVIAALGLVMAGVSNIIISGSRAGSDTAGRIDAQDQVRTAFGRLEFEGRCADSATLISSGTGVHFHLPSQCSHATGDTSWCMSGGTLTRYPATTCTGTAQVFATGVTNATPFALLTATGDLPRLQITLTIDGFTQTDAITLRNASAS